MSFYDNLLRPDGLCSGMELAFFPVEGVVGSVAGGAVCFHARGKTSFIIHGIGVVGGLDDRRHARDGE